MADPFAPARERAFVLASSGGFLLWPNIASVLAHEGYGADAIKKLGKDREAQREITDRILAFERANPKSPDETRMTRWSRSGVTFKRG